MSLVEPGSALPARPSPGAAGARLGELYAENARMVYGLCRMLLNDPTDAEDATQQVFLSAYRSLLKGTEVEKPSAWLGTIARNECKARYAVRSRDEVSLDAAPTLVSPGADEQASGRAETAALYGEVAALPESQRAAVVLRDIYGLRYDEVAAALGTSRPAVESLLFRGRRRLQRRLRPGLAAGVLVVPLSLHESLAYAVPGFAAAAGPLGATAGVVAAPFLAKAAAVGAAAALAGSAGLVAERQIRDRPARPAETPVAVPAAPRPETPPAASGAAPVRSLVSADTRLLAARTGESATADERDEPQGERAEHAGEAERDAEDDAAADREQADGREQPDEHEPVEKREQADGREQAEQPADRELAPAGVAEQESAEAFEPEAVEIPDGPDDEPLDEAPTAD